MAYAARYTNQYYDIGSNLLGGSTNQWKWEIYEDGYGGAVEEVKGRAYLTYGVQGSEDPFGVIFPCSLTIELMSETDEQFSNLYTNDERKFLAKLYYTDGGGPFGLRFMGYLISGQYSAPYDMERNYTMSFVFSDMLENLKEIPFGDEDGVYPTERMSKMAGILMCLARTDLDVTGVYEAVQLAIGDVDPEVFDDKSALEEAYFDPLIYVQDGVAQSSYDVLQSLLFNVQARIYQHLGSWFVESVREKWRDQISYRTRDMDGAQIFGGFLNLGSRILIRKWLPASAGPKVTFHSRSQIMKMAETFGTVTVTQDYGMKESNNLLLKSDFVDVDLDNGELEGWTYEDVNDEQGVDTIPSIVTALDGGTNVPNVLQIDFRQSGTGTGLMGARVISDPIPLSATDADYTLKLEFGVFPYANNPEAYIYYNYRVYIDVVGTKYYLNQFEEGFTVEGDPFLFLMDNDEVTGEDGYIRKYATHGQWSRTSLTVLVSGAPRTTGGDLVVEFRFFSNRNADYDDITTFLTDEGTTESFPTTRGMDNKRRVHVEPSVDLIYQYELMPGDDAADSPDIERPGDYSSQTFHYVWKLKNRIPPLQQGVEPHEEPWLKYIQLSNVVAQYFPAGEEPEESTESESVLAANTKRNREVTLLHGDLPEDDNYKNISRGWYSFEDGTPIQGGWMRRDGTINTEKSFVEQAKDAYETQYAANRWKLTGSFDIRSKVPFFFNTFQEVRNGRVYIPTYLHIDTKECSEDWEGIEIYKGLGTTDAGTIDPADLEREHSEEFSDEFS